MTTTIAKNLAKEPPRSPYDEIDGLPWLARLIDKVRALKAGTLADYHPYPCGGDQNFIATFGLETEALKAKIDSGASDAEIREFVKQHLPADWEAKRDAYRTSQRTAYPAGSEYEGYLKGSVQEYLALKPGADTSKLDNYSRLICAEEGHPIP